MAAGFLGRVFRLGRALVSYGLGGGPHVGYVTVCGTSPLDVGVSASRRIDLGVFGTSPLDVGPSCASALDRSIAGKSYIIECGCEC